MFEVMCEDRVVAVAGTWTGATRVADYWTARTMVLHHVRLRPAAPATHLQRR